MDETMQPQDDMKPYFEPFAELRTIAVHWDVSALLAPAQAASNRYDESKYAAEDLPAGGVQSAEEATGHTGVSAGGLFDPFPEPRTMPAAWDMSELI